MKTLLTVLLIVGVASVALAEKPVVINDSNANRVECAFENVMYEWDFSDGDHGFTASSCDDGGLPVWELGNAYGEDCFGTIIAGDYLSDSGDALNSPAFMVDESSYLVQIYHFFDIETSYDGGNLMVNGVVVDPMDGYPDDEISDSTSYYAWCVDGQPGFTGHDPIDFFDSCFDLGGFIGEEVTLSFQFGSDSSVTYPGWYIATVLVGGDVVATDGATWTQVKGLYR
jgi:hypothetical protein